MTILPRVVRDGNSVGPEVNVRSLTIEAETLDVKCSLVKHEDVALNIVTSLVERAQVHRLVGSWSWSGDWFRSRSSWYRSGNERVGSSGRFFHHHHHVVVHHHHVMVHHHVIDGLRLLIS